MNSKKIITLAVILVLAVTVIVIVKMSGNSKPSEESLKVFSGATEKMVGSVLIKDAQGQVMLQRKGDAWFMVPKDAIKSGVKSQNRGIAGAMGTEQNAGSKPTAGLSASEFPADSGAIAQLLQNIVAMKKNTLVSENPANQSSFEVDTTRGCSVEAFDISGKSLGNAILGKNGADYNSIYVRSVGSNAVYLMLDVSRYAFATDNNRWTDKSIMKFDKATVKQISIAKKGAPAIVFAREDSAGKNKAWQLIAPPRKPRDTNKLDSTKFDEIVTTLSTLTAAEYEYAAPVDSVTGITDPSITITLNFRGGTTRTVAIGNMKSGQNKFWVKIPEKQYLYLINDSDQKKFDKKPEDFEKQLLKPVKAVAAPMPPKIRKALKR